MADNVNGANKGTMGDSGQGTSGTANVSNPPVSTPFPNFGFPGPAGPSMGSYFTGSSFQQQPQPEPQADYSSKIDYIIANLAN